MLHYTAMKSARAAIERLCDPQAEVSAHYLISAQGQITQMVDEDRRAWHAGAGEWRAQNDINSRSIGIELDNRGDHPFSEPLMAALEGLLAGVMERWAIPAAGVIGHSDMAPGRKADPGPRFDWARLQRRGLAAAPGTVPEDLTLTSAAFALHARKAGFTADVDAETLLQATRLRYRPWRTGPLCAEDFAL